MVLLVYEVLCTVTGIGFEKISTHGFAKMLGQGHVREYTLGAPIMFLHKGQLVRVHYDAELNGSEVTAWLDKPFQFGLSSRSERYTINHSGQGDFSLSAPDSGVYKFITRVEMTTEEARRTHHGIATGLLLGVQYDIDASFRWRVDK